MDRTTRDNNNEHTCITHRERARSNKSIKAGIHREYLQHMGIRGKMILLSILGNNEMHSQSTHCLLQI